MQMKHCRLSEAIDVHKFLRAYRSHPPLGWWFRGQSNVEWGLVPKAGHPEFSIPGERHIGRFNDWTKQAIAYLPDLPKNEWERLAVAQHYGLATCLLDWTFNPLVALYFACSDSLNVDGAVYCYDPPAFVDENGLQLAGTKCNGIGLIPRAISARILNQKAAFTVHLPPNESLQVGASDVVKGEPNLVRLQIGASQKSELLKMLNDYGVNRVTLFPDLEGLSHHVNWETQIMVARHSEKAG